MIEPTTDMLLTSLRTTTYADDNARLHDLLHPGRPTGAAAAA